MNGRALFALAAYFAILVVAPLAGLAAVETPIRDYLVFPPRPGIAARESFSWAAFGLLAAILAFTLAPFLHKLATSTAPPDESGKSSARFPAFGWIGISLTALAWLLAWSRLSWFAPWQGSTFTPLWLGYILTLNGLTWRRTGACPLTREPGFLLALFPLSAVFWWSFEHLNRFVGNWHYPDAARVSDLQYLLEATLPFSTILPAIYSTASWLGTHPRLSQGLDTFRPLRLPSPTKTGIVTLGAGALALAATAAWPGVVFPFVWLAPMLLLSGVQLLSHGKSALDRALRTGRYAKLWRFALAGLVCGFFWELWNFRSVAHWEYRIPYVGGFRIFAMPVLGYAGYLPFGITCALFADLLLLSVVRTTNRFRE